MLNLLSYGLRPEVTCLSRMPFPRFTVTVPLARHLVSSVSPRSLRSLATRVKRSRLRLGRGCGECEECRKKRPTLSRHHHSSSRGLVLPLLSSPYNHFQAFQSSTVVTGWTGSGLWILQITVYYKELLTVNRQGTNHPRSILSFMDISILYLMVLAFHATRFPLSSHSRTLCSSLPTSLSFGPSVTRHTRSGGPEGNEVSVGNRRTKGPEVEARKGPNDERSE